MDRLEYLCQPIEMSDEEKELRQWLKKNSETLAKYDACEIVSLAVTGGFDRALAISVIVYFRDALAGSHVDNRARMQELLFDMAVKRVQDMQKKKELDLMPLWKSVVEYNFGTSAHV